MYKLLFSNKGKSKLNYIQQYYHSFSKLNKNEKSSVLYVVLIRCILPKLIYLDKTTAEMANFNKSHQLNSKKTHLKTPRLANHPAIVGRFFWSLNEASVHYTKIPDKLTTQKNQDNGHFLRSQEPLFSPIWRPVDSW